MYYEAYDYHCGDTSPIGDPNDMIFGMELEIDNPNSNIAELLDNAVENNILTVPWNEGDAQGWKILQNDSSVYKEIILCANTKHRLLKCIQTLNDYGFNDENFANSSGTSCHIHFNRRYLNDLGITEANMFKMMEFFAPVIYAISGRNERSFNRWAEPRSGYTLKHIDWQKRGEQMYYLSPSDDRYTMVNVTRSSTIELRAFSNSFNFDYRLIQCYLDFCILLIHLCEYMKGKLYSQEWENLLTEVKIFFEMSYPDLYRRFNLADVLRHDAHFTQFQQRLDNYRWDKHLLIESERWLESDLLMQIYTHRDLYLIKRVTMTPQGLENAKQAMKNQLFKLLSYEYKYYMSYLTHNEIVRG